MHSGIELSIPELSAPGWMPDPLVSPVSPATNYGTLQASLGDVACAEREGSQAVGDATSRERSGWRRETG